MIVALVFIGYRQPQGTAIVANALNVSTSSETSVNDVVAANVAAGVAQTTNLPIATSVTNLAISTQALSEFAQSDGTSTTKPQLIETTATNRLVNSYTVVDGDSVDTLAAKFGLTKETIKWANNLTTDSLAAGAVIKILPINGVLYTVKSTDTIDSIATKYVVDKTRLVLYNDLDVSGLVVGSSIILPDGVLPTNERPGYVAAIVYYLPTSANNGYSYGNCTWYAYERRVQLGMPVSGNWGNANTWAYYAAGSGFLVNHTPSIGAVLVDTSGYFGHVAVVESIEDNGDIVISEMNNYAYGGWNIVNNRTISAGQAAVYRYIH